MTSLREYGVERSIRGSLFRFSERLPRLGLLPSLAMTVIVLLSSCRPDFTAEQNATESLMNVLSNVESTSNEVDGRLIRQYAKDIDQKCQKIQNEMTDTVSIEDAQTLVDFCGLKEHLQSCLSRKELIDAELVKTRNQLFNLRSDLKEGRAEKDSVNKHIEQEFLFVESLQEGADQLIVELNGCFETYSELKEEIDRLIIDLPEKEEK